jgi:hypothetical protein
MLYREIVTVCCENNAKHVSICTRFGKRDSSWMLNIMVFIATAEL